MSVNKKANGTSSASRYVTFQGCKNFRLRIIMAILSGKAVKIEKIRSDDMNPGLKDYEVSFLRLIEAVTNGSSIEISYTGTAIIFKPGIVTGGSYTHACPNSKPVGYFVEPMLYLAPFSKKKFSLLFRGITASHTDAGLEAIKWGLLPVMEKFGVRECALHTLKRGSPPLGGGEVHLVVDSLISQPITMHALDTPMINKIRGVAYSTRVSPAMVNRMIDASRKVLRDKQVGCEVNITADVWRGENSGKSPGWGITLVAENKQGWRYFSQSISSPGDVPEDIGTKVAYQLLDEINNSSVVGRNQLPLALIFMVIGKEDLGRLRISKNQIDSKFVQLLRDVKKVFGTQVILQECEDGDESDMVLTVKGIGFTNTNKKIA
ncbi:rRNA-processing endoribonuclease [Hanseniaspora osmophila]|uniref:RNA 3'-terminal phosphate cyclase-like protein n=1 Tax=Hanseniaspora osmophila TaxID=56408 RepID=A0A1E5RE82_9ASCO|nr:RNA 3'-terminal phosphate cyclase-like protein [Hanseniaspora osmophila]